MSEGIRIDAMRLRRLRPRLAELADLRSSVFGAAQQVIFFLDAIPPRLWRNCSRRSWLVLGRRMRTCSASHCTFTGRPIHPGGKL